MAVLLLTAALVPSACAGHAGGGGGDALSPRVTARQEYPRGETLYMTGTQWSPPDNWNPLMNWRYATGTVGLVYETLFLYDPQKDTFTPWLAEGGLWTSATTYRIAVRRGVTWSDGHPLTAEDVAFTLTLCRYRSVSFSPLCGWMTKAVATGPSTVDVTFSTPNHQEWDNWLFTTPILPKHLWQGRSEPEITTGDNGRPVGTGPYEYLTHSADRMVWKKARTRWWAVSVYGLDPKPTYVVDLVTSSNAMALAKMLRGELDLSNNYLPGVASLVTGGYGLKTYLPAPPYMLPANTVWLVPNTTRPPLDNAEFRKALACSIDVDRIVRQVYNGLVTPSDKTGLLPYWDRYVDRPTVSRLGFRHDVSRARALLAAAGFRDADGNGFVEDRYGVPVSLTLTIPSGWTDWKEASAVIAAGARAAGIAVKTETLDTAALVDARALGRFDLVLANERQVSNTPWTYYDFMFRMPVLPRQTTVNFARYENPAAWSLVERLDRTRTSDEAEMKRVLARLQEIHLTQMPIIPLWSSGLWAQYSETVWTGWPSAGGREVFPTSWRDYWQMGSIYMLAALTPAPARARAATR
jgi:peptide/nickel transport system substrate-binding protein